MDILMVLFYLFGHEKQREINNLKKGKLLLKYREQMKQVLLVNLFFSYFSLFSNVFFSSAVEVLLSLSALKPLFLRTFLSTTAFISLSPRIQELYENALLHS